MSEKPPTIIRTGVIACKEEDMESIVWKVENFHLVQQDRNLVEKQCFEFETGKTASFQTKWEIGLQMVSTKLIGVYLKLLDATGIEYPVSVNAKLELVYRDGSTDTDWSGEVAGSLNKNMTLKHGEMGFGLGESDWADWLDEITNALTFKIEMRIQNKVTILHSGSPSTTKIRRSLKAKLVEKVQRDYAALLMDTTSSDIKIVCSDEKKISAHTLVLKSRCPVFSSMLRAESEFSECQNGVIRIDDISSKPMEILVHYLYTGELLPTWCDPTVIFEFVYAAGKYQLTELLEVIDQIIGEGDDSICTLKLLNLVHKLELKTAEEKLLKGLVKKTNQVKSCEDLFAIYCNSK